MCYHSVNACAWRQRLCHSVLLILQFVMYCTHCSSYWLPHQLSCLSLPFVWSFGLPVGHRGVCDVWCELGVEVSSHAIWSYFIGYWRHMLGLVSCMHVCMYA